MLHAIIPVKTLEQAKGRLAPVLSPLERRSLVLAMLGDVLAALRHTPAVSSVGVISRDFAVLAQAQAAGAQPLHDTAHDLNSAIGQAAAHAAATGATALLVLPADVPLITAADIEALVAAGTSTNVTLAPSHDGGTNALLVRPALALPFQFGVNSLARHQYAAQARNLTFALTRPPGLELDVDTCDDLLALADTIGTTATQQLVRELMTARAMCA